MQAISQDQVIQWLVSMLGGGLAGATLSIAFASWNSRRSAHSREVGTIHALIAEVRSAILLCSHNAKLQAASLAPFITLPCAATTRVVFEERENYPKLASIQPLLEHYALATLHLNQLVNLYRVISPLAGTAIHDAARERNDLRNAISAICAGNSRIEAVGPEGFLIFPTFAGILLKRLEGIPLRASPAPSARDALMPSA